ncbi:MAG: hypothetical protein AB7O26_00300, partial [Planctomycetaceae bacterium]
LEAKLNSLGADIRRVNDEPANMPESLKFVGECAPDSSVPLVAAPLLDGPTWLKRRRSTVNRSEPTDR